MVKKLIDFNANIFYEYKKKEKENANIFYKYKEKEKTMLHYAIKRITKQGKKEIEEEEDSIAKILMEKGVIDLNPSTINCVIKYKNNNIGCENLTQLMYYIINKDEEKIEKLINTPSININVTDSEGINAYGYAKTLKLENVIKMIENKFDVTNKDEKNIKDFFGITSKKKAMTFSAGVVFAGLGLIFKKSATGEMLYNIVEKKFVNSMEKVFNNDKNEDNKEDNDEAHNN